MKIIRGIDVSEHNGFIDWDDVAEAGIEFAIVRASYGKAGQDEMFLGNVNGAHSVGLQCGAYHYGYALTPEDAVIEAQNCERIIDDAGVLLELPVWYDMEDADGYKRKHGFEFSQENITGICRTFLENIQPLDCGIYASLSWLEDWIDWDSIGCAVWNAQWMPGYDPEPAPKFDEIRGYMWQYTDKCQIAGRLFDGNVLYLSEGEA